MDEMKPRLSWEDVSLTEEITGHGTPPWTKTAESIWTAEFNGYLYVVGKPIVTVEFSRTGDTAKEALRTLESAAKEQGWSFPELKEW